MLCRHSLCTFLDILMMERRQASAATAASCLLVDRCRPLHRQFLQPCPLYSAAQQTWLPLAYIRVQTCSTLGKHISRPTTQPRVDAPLQDLIFVLRLAVAVFTSWTNQTKHGRALCCACCMQLSRHCPRYNCALHMDEPWEMTSRDIRFRRPTPYSRSLGA